MNDGIGKFPSKLSENFGFRGNIRSSHRLLFLRFVIILISSRFSFAVLLLMSIMGCWKVEWRTPAWFTLFVRPDFDSMNGEALIWTSAVSSLSSDTLNMPGYTLAASDTKPRAPLAFLLRLNSATLASHADQAGPAPRTWGRNAWRARLKLNEAALAGYEWWDREISLKTVRKFWLSGKHQEQSSPSLPPFCYYSNLKSLLFCCFVIDVYNGLLKSRVTNARMVHVTFVRPDFDSVNGEALIWTSAVSSPSSDTLNMPGYTLAASDKESIDPKYLCNSCGSLLREAMQTACGHFFCRSCLGNLVM